MYSVQIFKYIFNWNLQLFAEYEAPEELIAYMKPQPIYIWLYHYQQTITTGERDETIESDHFVLVSIYI